MKDRGSWSYLQSKDTFIDHRIQYYSNTKVIPISFLEEKIFPSSLMSSIEGQTVLTQRNNVVETLRESKAPITIVTATKDRPHSISNAYKFLADQVGNINWNWVIINNGEDKETKDVISQIKDNDNRVLSISYQEETGCAYPIRNFGLDIVHYAKYNHVNNPGFVLVVDSDDRLYGENSLRELFKIANSKFAKSRGLYIAHGFADSEIHQTDGTIMHVPNPRDWDSKFPAIYSLAEVFDKGLNILSGMFPIELLSWLRYPKEFSFEDDAFNQKIMLQAKKHNMVWLAECFPITTKQFHQESMSGKNNNLGNKNNTGKVGEHVVTGIRAQIVSYSQSLSDYYVREDL